MSPISRGFRGRRAEGTDPTRIPPGQYVTNDYPVLSESVDELAVTMADETVFDYGLERLLDGLEARSSPKRQGARRVS